MNRLPRPTALVTGGASGIGRAAAERLAADGYAIAVIDRSDPGEPDWVWYEMDLDGTAGAPANLATDIDVLVNAAGLPPRPGEEAAILRVNFLALRRLTLSLLPNLRPGARIVNMASKAGARWVENIDQVRRLLERDDRDRLDDFVRTEAIDPVRAYDLSKEAVVAWTKAMTGPLLARDMRMNAVSPAAVETPILGDFIEAFGTRATRGVELTRRSGQPTEIADVIAFLAAPESAWVKGCNIECDGGLTAQLETENLIGWTPGPLWGSGS